MVQKGTYLQSQRDFRVEDDRCENQRKAIVSPGPLLLVFSEA